MYRSLFWFPQTSFRVTGNRSVALLGIRNNTPDSMSGLALRDEYFASDARTEQSPFFLTDDAIQSGLDAYGGVGGDNRAKVGSVYMPGDDESLFNERHADRLLQLIGWGDVLRDPAPWWGPLDG